MDEVNDPGEIVPTINRSTHISYFCKVHTWLRWSSKNIYGRTLRYDGIPTHAQPYGTTFVEVRNLGVPFPECDCPAMHLVPTGYAWGASADGKAFKDLHRAISKSEDKELLLAFVEYLKVLAVAGRNKVS